MTLYELKTEFQTLLSALEGGEADTALAIEELEALQMDIADKLDGYARVIAHLDGQLSAFKAEEERMAKRRKSIESNREGLKQRIFDTMQGLDVGEIKTPLFVFKIQNSPASVYVDDVDAVPEKYLIPQPLKVDKNELLKDLKSGALKETSYFWLTQSQHLRIR